MAYARMQPMPIRVIAIYLYLYFRFENHNQTFDTDILFLFLYIALCSLAITFVFPQILMNAHLTHVEAMACARIQSMPIRVIAMTGIQATIVKQVGR